MLVYCDTSTLPHNLERHHPVEFAAMKQLNKEFLYGSHLVEFEANNTENDKQRTFLIKECKQLRPIPNDIKLRGYNTVSDPYGGQCTSVLLSDVQDEALRNELIERGLETRDAEHITQAICNHCGVFLTVDKRTIIKPHGQWLEKRFPRLRILRPSQLLQDLVQRT